MNIQCPNCKKKFKVPDEYEGKTAKCPSCKHDFIAVNKDFIYRTKPSKNIDFNPSNNSKWQMPDNGYLHFFGNSALVIACFCLYSSIIGENVTAGIGGLLLFFLGILINGIGTAIRAVNANTEELKKFKN